MVFQTLAESPCERRARFVDYHRTHSPDLRNRLVRRHVPFAQFLANRFIGRGVPFDDLAQVATIGLIEAVDRYNPHRGITFTTFAGPTITGELRHHFRDRSWDVHVPRPLQERHLKVTAAAERLTTELARTPSTSEIASVIGLADEDVVEAIGVGCAFHSHGLSVPFVARNGALVEVLLTEDVHYGEVDNRVLAADLIARLPRRQQEILRLTFWESKSQEAVAEHLGLSQMHVSRLLHKSLAHLRLALERAD